MRALVNMKYCKDFKKILNKKAFTLIELVAIVLIIGILSAIGLPQYQRALESSRSSEAIVTIGNIVTAQEMQLLQNGSFTSNFSDLMLNMPLERPTQSSYGGGGQDSQGESQFFRYDISGCEYGECTISAFRKGNNGQDLYEIRLTGMDASGSKGQRSCHSSDDFGSKICEQICGVDNLSADGSCDID